MTAAKLSAVEPDADPSKDPNRLFVVMDSLTAGEIEDAEDLAGVPITDFFDPVKPKGRISRAIGCVVRRRIDPAFTWEQARDLKVFFGEEKVPPTGGRGSSTRSRSRNTSA